jgi:hypothetical protein
MTLLPWMRSSATQILPHTRPATKLEPYSRLSFPTNPHDLAAQLRGRTLWLKPSARRQPPLASCSPGTSCWVSGGGSCSLGLGVQATRQARCTPCAVGLVDAVVPKLLASSLNFCLFASTGHAQTHSGGLHSTAKLDCAVL